MKSFYNIKSPAILFVAFMAFIPLSRAVTSLTNSLVAYWPMDQISGGVLTPDLGPNGFDLKPYFNVNIASPTNFNGTNIIQAGFGPHPAGNQNGTNSLIFSRPQTTLLGYISSGYPGLMPPPLLKNFTLSFWVLATNIPNVNSFTNSPNYGRVFCAGDTTGGNGLWDVGFDQNGSAQLAHIERQSPSFAGGIQYGNFTAGGNVSLATNAPFADNTWHIITVVHQVFTNETAPVIGPMNVAPVNKKATLSWNSIALDNQFPNWTNQVDTNQNYLVQKTTSLSPASWTTIGTVGTLGNPGPTSFTDNHATNANAYYRVIQPRMRYAQQVIYLDANKADMTMGTEPFLSSATNFTAPYGAWHLNAFSFGGILRAQPTSWTTVQVGEAALWSRVLSLGEIAAFMNDGITNAGSMLPPLSASLTGEFIAAAANDTDNMAWTASKPPATLAFYPGNTDVTAQSSFGTGGTNAPVLSNTVFQLVATRGGASVTSSVPVIAVSNVTANWHYLDDFNYETNGPIAGQGDAGQGGWVNPFAGAVVTGMERMMATNSRVDGNKSIYFECNPTGGVAGIYLKTRTIQLNSSNTLFFRFYIDYSANVPDAKLGGDIPNLDMAVALTDIGIRDVVDVQNAGNVGIRIIRNNPANGGTIGPIDLQAVNGTAAMQLSPTNYSYVADPVNGTPFGLDAGHVYSVWIDVQNLPKNVAGGYGSGGVQTNGDLFQVWLQEDTWKNRVNLFSEYTQPSTNSSGTLTFPAGWMVSDRDYSSTDITFPPADPLSTLYIVNRGTTSEQDTNLIRFDDFYLSKVGIEPSVPHSANSLAP
jgi:hypothetical protein